MKIYDTFPPQFPNRWYFPDDEFQREKQHILDAMSNGEYECFFWGYGNPLWITIDGQLFSVAKGKLGYFDIDGEREFDGIEIIILVCGRFYFNKYICDDKWLCPGHAQADPVLVAYLERILEKELTIKCFREGDPQIPEKAYQLYDSLPYENRAVAKLAYKVINPDGTLGDLEWTYIETNKEEIKKMDAYLSSHQLQGEDRLIDLGHEWACEEWDCLGMFFTEVDCNIAERGVEGFPDIHLFINPSDYKVQISFD